MNDDKHGERIAALEAGQRALVDNVNRFVENSIKAAEDFQTEIRIISDRIGKANWPTYIAGLSLLGFIAAATLAPIWSELGDLHRRDINFGNELAEHQRLPIHPGAAETLKGMWLLRESDQHVQDYKHAEIERRLSNLEALKH